MSFFIMPFCLNVILFLIQAHPPRRSFFQERMVEILTGSGNDPENIRRNIRDVDPEDEGDRFMIRLG
jgi:hypothetical protein